MSAIGMDMLDGSTQAPALSLSGITRRYGGTIALNDVSFDVKLGEVHALVGENGAGKSTLIKMITGADFSDSGEVILFGENCTTDTARERIEKGVSAIYQELSIIPDMSALDNVFLDSPPRRGVFLDRAKMNVEFKHLADRFGVAIPSNATARGLSIADRQVLEIMRALRTKCRVLLLDEPTAALGPGEREKLFSVINDLRASGTALIFIAHDLDEVMNIADRVSVLRNGNLVNTGPIKEWSKISIVEAMLGEHSIQTRKRQSQPGSESALKVQSLNIPGRLSGISFEVRKGEVVGIAGLVGSGRTEVLHAICGLDDSCVGQIELPNLTRKLPWRFLDAMKEKIFLVPEDRKDQGIVPLLPGWANVGLPDLKALRTGLFVDRQRARDLARETTGPLAFDPARLDSPIGTLSGGNQQKLVIGKWLQNNPEILLLDEPTRGVDIGARQEIYKALEALTAEGLAVVLVSSDFEEVIEHSDRILLLSQGRILETVPSSEATPERLLSKIFLSEGKN